MSLIDASLSKNRTKGKVPTVLLRFSDSCYFGGFLRQWETFIGHPFSTGNKAHKDGFCSELIGYPGRGCDIFGDMCWPEENLMCVGLWEV